MKHWPGVSAIVRRSPAASPPPVIGGYRGTGWLRRHRRIVFAALILFSLFYGFAFALLGRFFLPQFSIPIVVLAALVVWLLPETGRPPTTLLSRMLFTFVVALLCWPDYLAIALPGLPWITMIRLVCFPMALVLLICLSVSAAFRAHVKDVLEAVPWVWRLMALFVFTATVTMPLSKEIATSINKYLLLWVGGVAVFIAACHVFTRPGAATRLCYTMWAITLLICGIGVWEASIKRLPWAGHIPSFLAVEDEHIQRILAGIYRSGSSQYRVQTKFTTSLGLGEFLAFATPFVLHIMMRAPRIWQRVAAAATLPLIFYVTDQSDSRLAAIGFFGSLLAYPFFWAALRWRRVRDSLFGPAIVMGYPAIMVGFMIASLYVHRLRIMIWGDGSQQPSNEARKAMYREGIPMVISNPVGHGIGMGADTLGYRNLAGVLTIDTYYLAVALEYGILGFIGFFGMLLVAIYKGARVGLTTRNDEVLLLVPALIGLTNFFIGKSVFSQQENHPLVFLLLGMMVALIWREKTAGNLAKKPAAPRPPVWRAPGAQ